MLRSIKNFSGYRLCPVNSDADGDIGSVSEAYLDDRRWVVRHLVADTGGWLTGRQVLISPHSITAVDDAKRTVDVALTRSQVENAPGIDSDKPVARQHEIDLYDHYGYPYYWTGADLWGMAAWPLAGQMPAPGETPDTPAPADADTQHAAGDSHLRSSKEVIGYNVQASDGGIGHIDDFLIDDRSWQVRLVVVDTRNWLPGRSVVIAPQAISQIDWARREVMLTLTRDAVKASPLYQPAASMSVEDERQVQRHYEGWQ